MNVLKEALRNLQLVAEKYLWIRCWNIVKIYFYQWEALGLRGRSRYKWFNEGPNLVLKHIVSTNLANWQLLYTHVIILKYKEWVSNFVSAIVNIDIWYGGITPKVESITCIICNSAHYHWNCGFCIPDINIWGLRIYPSEVWVLESDVQSVQLILEIEYRRSKTILNVDSERNPCLILSWL